jgi:hypothetical protein
VDAHTIKMFKEIHAKLTVDQKKNFRVFSRWFKSSGLAIKQMHLLM